MLGAGTHNERGKNQFFAVVRTPEPSHLHRESQMANFIRNIGSTGNLLCRKRTVKMIKVSPSLLAADFSRLGEEVKKAEASGADWLHLDVMDGMFVPNISFGPCVIESLRKISDLYFDVHLMINEPVRYIEDYRKSGANGITVHYEACGDVEKTLAAIKSYGIKAGISIKPATPVSVLEKYIKLCDLVLIMTVEPGFGGQKLIESTVEKIAEVKKLCERYGKNDIEIEADGGITPGNLKVLAEKGLTVAVAGSAVFRAEDPAAVIEKMKNII